MGNSICRSTAVRSILAGHYIWAALIGLTALALRIGHIQDSTSSPLFNAPMADARTYAEQAAELAAGHWDGGPESFRRPPLYSYGLALVFRIAEQGYYLPRLVQAVLGAVSCVLIYFLGRIAFPESVARGAGIAAAAYGPLIYYSGELLPTTTAILLSLLFLLCLLRPPLPNLWNGLLSGFLLGLAALTMANMLALLPLLLLWLHLSGGPSRGGRALVALCGCGLAIAPVAVRNAVVGHDQVLISSNTSLNFYLGNNADYDRTKQIHPRREWESLVECPQAEAGIQRPSAKSRYFLAQSWRFISQTPWLYLKLSLYKIYLFWHGDELAQHLDPYYARNDSAVLRLLLWKYGLAFPFGIVAPLALVGMVSYWPNAASSQRVLPLFLLAYMFSVVAFFVTAQNRLPAVPLALLFAGFGLREILVRRGGDRLRLLVPAVVLLVATNIGAGTMDRAGGGFQHFALGSAYEQQGMKANAMREYRAVLARLPDHRESAMRLGRLHAKREEYPKAIRLYEEILERDPEVEPIRFLLANAHLLAGHHQRAIAAYQSLIASRPQWADLHGRLGYAYLRNGQPALAIVAYRRTLELQPDSSLVRYQLARIYEVQDSLQAAAEQYRVLLVQNPANPDIHTRLADLLIRGESTEANTVYLPQNATTTAAEAHLDTAIRQAPNRREALWSLGMMLARQTRYAEATPYFERLVEIEPDNNLVLTWLANLSRRTGHDEQAEQYLSRYAEVQHKQQLQDQAEREMDDMIGKIFPSEKVPNQDR